MMTQDIFVRIRALDDRKIIKLLRYLGPMFFKDPRIRRLLDFEEKAGPLAALAVLAPSKKKALLDTNRSIWLARMLLSAFAAQPRFAEVLAKALDSVQQDELVLETQVPLGLITDSLRLLASAHIAETGGAVNRNLITDYQTPDALVKIAQIALAAESTPSPIQWSLPYPNIAVDDVHPVIAVDDVHPIIAVDDVHPIIAVDDVHPIIAVDDVHPIITVDDVHPVAPIRSSLREVYPDIAVDDVHPVANTIVRFTVSLSPQETTDTAGAVRLPETPPEFEHKLLVHLLFGTSSAWDTLTWSVQRGTIKTASFALPAPAIQGRRALVEARANFYLNQRWCGEGQRNLDVRRDSTVAMQTNIPLPKTPPWRRDLVLQPDAHPPDLTVRIQKGTIPGDFSWTCLSPHLKFPPPAKEGDNRMSLKEDAANFVRMTFAPFANMPLESLKMAELEGAGEKIYRSTPKYFRDCYWTLWHKAAAGGFKFNSVQIITDEPCMPWELMRLSDLTRAPHVAPELLAIRHCVGRWLADESASMRQWISVSKAAVSASSYDGISGVSGKLPWAAKEHKLMVDTYRADEVPLTSERLRGFLEGGVAQALHIACHGQMSIIDPDASYLLMEDTPQKLTPLLVARHEVCNGFGRQHPLVFLNACDVGAIGASLSLVAGFPAAFLYAGASALVSPLWAINDERAQKIAEEFYREAFVASGGKPLGAVLRDIRARWKEEKHLTYLAYVLYGDPMAQVDYH
ncbi:CHAT domain-containing protein [Nitrosospira multiformis]|uniref:CHAT domain-containing protein n=1 Tax=Nitrosospira multiformis TaxID=1231 RepID=A0A1H8FEB6_9PROT|nr:CHAT domain-containing protein [Nitrosospira multiformis]SEN30123.1 CHAT domain-containing protein [Nitrosospira multiformis]